MSKKETKFLSADLADLLVIKILLKIHCIKGIIE
jgi:hypothetical protein